MYIKILYTKTCIEKGGLEMREHNKPFNRDPGSQSGRKRRTLFNDKSDYFDHPKKPKKSSPIHPMPPLGCTGKYFKDMV